MTNFQFYGTGVSCYDWNKDGLDDLTVGTGEGAAIFLNNGSTLSSADLGITGSQETKGITWVDYDNDGDADLLLTRFFGPLSLYRNDGNLVFTEVTGNAGLNIQAPMACHGASWGDVNNDSWLDLYICNYSFNNGQTNLFYLNNGDGTFTECATARGIDNGSFLSFQAVFIDLNSDGWQDIYLINDKDYAENTFYLNDGTGYFTDATAGTGLDIMIDAMSNSFADFDNDGDFDLYVSNTVGNNLLINDGYMTFTEEAESYGLYVGQISWAAVWLDANLDMHQDIFVATAPLINIPISNEFYFSLAESDSFQFDQNSGFAGVPTLTYSAASGDFNGDGLPDLASSSKESVGIKVHLNNLQSGNYLKVTLEGTQSNKDGIGSVIRCYADGIQQMRYTFCGEQYMSQNSQHILFGLRDNSIVDSVSVTWPSGVVDVIYDVAINQNISIVEGSTAITVDAPESELKRMVSLNYNLGIPYITTTEEVEIELYNTEGKVLLSRIVNETQHFTDLANGVYILRIRNKSGETLTKKLAVTL